MLLPAWKASPVEDPENAEEMDLRNFIFSLKNADKFYGGQVSRPAGSLSDGQTNR